MLEKRASAIISLLHLLITLMGIISMDRNANRFINGVSVLNEKMPRQAKIKVAFACAQGDFRIFLIAILFN